MLESNPRLRRLDALEAAEEEPGAREQHDGERDLGDDQSLMQAACAAPAERARPVFPEHVGRSGGRELERREQPGEESAGQRHREQEEQHRRIGGDRVGARQRPWRQAPEGHGAAPGKEQAHRSRQQRQDEVLGQRLTHQPQLCWRRARFAARARCGGGRRARARDSSRSRTR